MRPRNAAVHIERAAELSRRGLVDDAVRELGRGLAASGPEAALLSERAALRFQQRLYNAALADLKRAIALRPDSAPLRAQRSGVLSQVDRLPEALAELARARKLAPEDDPLLFEHARLLLRCGKLDAAAAALRPALRRPDSRAEALLHRAMLSLGAGKVERAAGELRRALAEAPAGGGLAARARFYALVASARLAGRRPARPRRGPRLLLCGLGLYPPYTATLDAVEALSRCDVLVNNVSGHETRDLLSTFTAKILPGMFDAEGDATLWSARILSQLGRGKTVGFVTRGHPLLLGGLGVELVERCAQRGIPHETMGAFTSVDALLSQVGPLCASRLDGLRVCDGWTACESAPDAASALIVYFDNRSGEPFGAKGVARLARKLRAAYGARHACFVFGPHYGAAPAAARIGELGRSLREFDTSQMIFVPPR